MDQKPHVCVLVPAHCAPNVLKMTLGSFLDVADGSYDASIAVGLHENYHHYHPGVADIEAMSPPVMIVKVKEIDWQMFDGKNYIAGLLRYSRMHSKSLRALFEAVAGKEFTHVLVMDHDLVFKGDFVKEALSKRCDVVGSLFDDFAENYQVKTDSGHTFTFAPKLSVWHLLLSRKAYEFLMRDIGVIEPAFEAGIVYDTFAKANILMGLAGFRKLIYSKSMVEKFIEHKGAMSFNWGQRCLGGEYPPRLLEAEREYERRFPNGIAHLLAKVKQLGEVR